jgi:hypothetical protein
LVAVCNLLVKPFELGLSDEATLKMLSINIDQLTRDGLAKQS